jgi:hypothetical protein
MATGARYEVAIDGKTRPHRDIKAVAIECAEFLKVRNLNSEITVRDLDGAEKITIKSSAPYDRKP